MPGGNGLRGVVRAKAREAIARKRSRWTDYRNRTKAEEEEALSKGAAPEGKEPPATDPEYGGGAALEPAGEANGHGGGAALEPVDEANVEPAPILMQPPCAIGPPSAR